MLRSLIKPAYFGLREVWLRLAVQPGSKPDFSKEPTSIFVISERRLGDVCLEIPTLQALRASYPNAFLAVIAPDELAPLIGWASHPDQILSHKAIGSLNKRQWDVAIDLTADYQLRPARIAAESGAAIRIGFDVKGRGRFFNVPLTYSNSEPMHDLYARVLTPLGKTIDRIAPMPEIFLHSAAEWPRQGIAFHPGAHHSTQRWPLKYFAELVRKIHSEGQPCLVLGAEAERSLVEEIVDRAGVGIPAITSDLMMLAAALQSSRLLICNNSGPLHLAALLGVPTLSFMGPTVKSKWFPRGASNLVLRRDDLQCIGCNQGYCKIRTHACMTEITPEIAYAAYSRVRSQIR